MLMDAPGQAEQLAPDPVSGSKAVEAPQLVSFDAVLPATMAGRAEESGVKKVAVDTATLLALSVLAGAFIAFGAMFATVVSAGSAELPYGIVKLLSGLVFSLGFLLVVIGGAELFTGNNLIVMAWASGKVTTGELMHNWTIVFAGNFVGALATAALMFLTTQYSFGHGAVGLAALSTAQAKSSLAFVPAIALGIMCNALVCLASWMCYSARSNVDKFFTVVFPVAAFVAGGFEHCIANMYFIPLGLLIKSGAPDAFWAAIGKTAADFPALTWGNFLVGNLLPVTIGNIIGGSIMVAAVYWFIYLRNRKA
jgi:formate transporter